ncbi:cation:proton antiporter [Clostridium sporogenes]|uniref:Sodium:proton antiporter n=1 Tax=Clostridium botulinum TaxID=1491 RepID=A0A6M0T3Y8_CLOBO|nr:cation:proton antiporter [Clostridium sporogenes]NFA62093.1 sodium:proton antiporter [Clostridium botulinum]NFI74982.1 sodium:proton antiporter [Clostridium sporogenes]NFM25907.1 sodium:proton antiporter [Clostridium sporogenes]NFP63109.1 sodium:proton antiporter [Clostridium sporogenes]NFU94046.1 sodium:proton antiporter [Clostridium sporogenes]
MENINYDSLLILSLFAFITPLFINAFKKYKVPFVVGELFVGIIIGKSFFNLIQVDPWIQFLSNLGLAYLMFLSGLEIDVHSIKVSKGSKGTNNIIICITMSLLSIIVSFIICKFLYSLDIIKDTMFMTFLFSAAAPGFLVPFLKQKDILKTEFGQILLIFSLIGEFVSLIAMTIISSKLTYGLSYKSFLFLIVIIVSFLIYKILSKLQGKYDFATLATNNTHLEVRAAFALILILVTISNKTGTEIALGSFLAGVIFTFLTDKSHEEDLKYKLDIIGYGFLIPIFFIMVGVNLNVTTIFKNPNNLISIPLIILIIYIIKFVPSLVLKRKFGTNKALSGSIILSSQLSILIVGAQIAFNLKLISQDGYSCLILTAVISCMLFPFIFDKVMKYDDLGSIVEANTNKICVREVVPTNKKIFNKPLKDLNIPQGARIFLIIREEKELIPDGSSQILEGDVLLIAGLSDKSLDFLKILKDEN